MILMSLATRRFFGWLVLSSVLTAGSMSGVGQAQSLNPRFGDEIVILEGWDILLSQDGSFAAGHSRQNIVNDEIEVRLWNLVEGRNKDDAYLEPMASISLAYRVPERLISSVEMRFSPDAKYLAVRKDYDLTVLTVPDLYVRTQITVSDSPGVYPDALSWSHDGRFVAMQGSGDLVVLAIETEEIYRHPLDEILGPVIAVDDGWLVLRFVYDERVLNSGFSFCATLAEVCTDYRIEVLVRPSYSQSVVAAPNGQTILTYGRDQVYQLGVWTWRQAENGDYERSSSPLRLDANIVPKFFSPNGRYMVTSPDRAIWDFETFTRIESGGLPGARWGEAHEVFSSQGEYFIALEDFDNLVLYRTGQENPVSFIVNVSELMDPTVFEIEYNSILRLSDDWALFNVEQSAALIPIIYQ